MALGGEDFMSVLHHPQSHFVTTNPRHLGDGIAIRLPQLAARDGLKCSPARILCGRALIVRINDRNV
jgi:hypothetical protein